MNATIENNLETNREAYETEREVLTDSYAVNTANPNGPFTDMKTSVDMYNGVMAAAATEIKNGKMSDPNTQAMIKHTTDWGQYFKDMVHKNPELKKDPTYMGLYHSVDANNMVTPCAGENCGTTTAQHSPECIAEHAAAVAGGRFVKVPAAQAAAVPAGMVIDAYAVLATEKPFEDGAKVQRMRQISGPPLWAVRHKGNCLNKSSEWEWEPMPSSRDDNFIARCRFASAEEAIAAALQGDGKP